MLVYRVFLYSIYLIIYVFVQIILTDVLLFLKINKYKFLIGRGSITNHNTKQIKSFKNADTNIIINT